MKKFTFIHTGDNHLGHSGNASRYNEYSALRIEKKTDDEMNVREHDINQAFKQVIDLAIEHKVDAVLDSGDLFDFWGYKQPKVLNFAIEQINRLNEVDIPFVVIIGNHDLPKQAGKGTYLEALNALSNVQAVYKGFYEKVYLEKHNVVIHCIPSTFTQDLLMDSFDEIEKEDGKINIAMAHLGVTVIDHYAENAVNSLVVGLDTLRNCKMDYFALGDYHEARNLGKEFNEHIWYCGSTERMGFGEIYNDPQVLLVNIEEQTKNVSVQSLLLNVRDMIELEEIDAANKSIEEINELIEKKIESCDLKDKIVRLRVRNLPTHLKKFINDEKIKELTEDALYFKFELKDKVNQTKGIQTSGTNFEGVLEGWNAFIDALESDASYDKAKLKSIGYNRLSDALEKVE